MDTDKDGYVSYPEYRASEDAKIAEAKKAAATAKP